MQDMLRLPSNCQESKIRLAWNGWNRFRCTMGQAVAQLPGRNVLVFPLALLLFLSAWQGLIWIGNYPAFILPSPANVASSAARTLSNGTLWHHARVTLFEVFSGLSIGLLAGGCVGIPFGQK